MLSMLVFGKYEDPLAVIMDWSSIRRKTGPDSGDDHNAVRNMKGVQGGAIHHGF